MNNKQIFNLLHLTFIIIFLLISCDEGTPPPPPEEEFKNPHEMTWTIDTLVYPTTIQTLMENIWGSSPENVYVVGHDATIKGQMWHFNGEEWSPVQLPIFPRSLTAITGFSDDNIWVAGSRGDWDTDSSLVLHFDGISWKEILVENHRRIGYIGDMWANNPEDIWFTGLGKSVLHYNGKILEEIDVEVPWEDNSFSNFYSIAGLDSNEIYMKQFRHNEKTQDTEYYAYKYNGVKWELFNDKSIFYNSYYTSADNVLYSYSYGISKFQNGLWQEVLPGDPALNYYGLCRLKEDYFIVAADYYDYVNNYARLYFFNGQNWKQVQLPEMVSTYIYDIWSDGKEIFAVGNLLSEFPQKTIILHGK